MDCTGRTFRHTLLAKPALGVIDIGKIVLHSDCIKRTDLRTLAATDAGSLTCLTGSGSLVLVDT